jgi:hypothetical protein
MPSIASLVFTVILLAIAFKTKPDSSSFRPFLVKESERISNEEKKKKSFLSRLLSPSLQLTFPDYKITDAVVFTIANVEDGRVYLGLFGSWFFLNANTTEAPNSNHTNDRNNAVEMMDTAESLRSKAISLKANRDFQSACTLFESAAKAYTSSGNNFESSKCYEDIFNTLTNIPNLDGAGRDRAIRAGNSAAKGFQSEERTMTRAGRVYESLGKYCKKLGKEGDALAHFKSAESCFEATDDG